jgi:uncharacterized damage-inducible protein DinB
MDLLENFRRQFAYDEWANREVLKALKKSPGDTTRPRKLLAHILSAENLWLERVLQQPQTMAVWPDVSLEQCELQITDLKQRWHRFFELLPPARLEEEISYKNSQGESWASNLLDILTHVMMHSAYHRGQIASQMRAAGETPAYTDFIHAVRTRQLE